MIINQIKQYVIEPTLKFIDLWSPEAMQLIWLTGWVESRYEYIVQVRGPAKSFWQVEPTTMRDHYANYLKYRQDLGLAINTLIPADISENDELLEQQLITNMAFACAMARLKYRRSPGILPAVDDLEGQARYWKQYYNTPLGEGSVEKFISMANELEA